MAIVPVEAAGAYGANLGGEALKSSSQASKPAGGAFAEMLEEAARDAVGTLQKAEATSMKAAAGEAEILDVVAAVHDAESTLRTVVAVRDMVVQSYQEILRMPI